ncbi:lipid kinase YegS [Hafnia alvei]|uniref:lipid kinase YegS n=1 Tax=Hafnia alvei TaxID=569 RepID=UPI0010343C90|nr:lipid kinase YegS [Hafnia alvei]TBM17442.1 lipid kinase YegS [Hafnia alvei]
MPQLHSALVILNGKGAGNQDVREAIDGLRTAGNTLYVRVTWEHGDAKRYVAEAVELGVETIVAGGGDGTINEVSDALSQHSESSRPVLAVLPLGTANDFATACLIPEEPQAALQLALQGRAVPIDFARINDKRVFINMATGGFGTKITTETPEKLKSILGGASYFLHGILRMDTLKADFCQISGPDFHWEGNALVVAIGNGRQAGGGQPLCPEALINDGKLDLRVLTSDELLPALLESLLKGESNKNVIEASLPWLEISSPHEMTLNLDGEPLSAKHFRIEIEPDAISLRLPPNCPLIG